MYRRNTRVRVVLALLAAAVVGACGDDPTDPVGPSNPVSIATAGLAEAVQGLGYTQQLEAAGGSGGYSWLLAAGSLPAGLTLSPSGAISGTPAAAGTSSFRVRVTDAGGRTASADLAIAVVKGLAVHTVSLPPATVGLEYTMQLQAVGGRGTHTWTVTGDGAASWLTVSVAGALSGTPGVSGASSLTVAVTDESGQQATREFPVVILDAVAVAPMDLPVGVQGRVYAVQLVATGGDGIYGWDIESGTLPAGLELGSAGSLTGIPGEGGVYMFTARVTDHAGRAGSRALTLTVERAPTIQTESVPPGQPGEPYAAQLAASGGTGAYTWTITDGSLPEGLSMSATGVITGTPTEMGITTFTVQVTDEASATHTRAFTLVVAHVTGLVSGTPIAGLAGEAGSIQFFGIAVPAGATRVTFTISGGTGDVDLYVRHGALPAQYVYDCRPFRPGNEEICTFVQPAPGNWYVMLRAYAAYEGVSLVANVEE